MTVRNNLVLNPLGQPVFPLELLNVDNQAQGLKSDTVNEKVTSASKRAFSEISFLGLENSNTEEEQDTKKIRKEVSEELDKMGKETSEEVEEEKKIPFIWPQVPFYKKSCSQSLHRFVVGLNFLTKAFGKYYQKHIELAGFLNGLPEDEVAQKYRNYSNDCLRYHEFAEESLEKAARISKRIRRILKYTPKIE